MKASSLLTGLFIASLNLLLLLCPLLLFSSQPVSSWPTKLWLCLSLLSLWSLLESSLQSVHRSDSSSSEGGFPWMQGLLLYGLLLLGLLEASSAESWSRWSIGGTCLLVTGVALRLLAISTLQHRFLDGVRLEENHTLVTNGIYQRLRHPSETGNLCLLVGCAWLLEAWWMGAGVLFLWFPLTLWRLRKEEELLKARFQEEFVKYRKSSGFLLPQWR